MLFQNCRVLNLSIETAYLNACYKKRKKKTPKKLTKLGVSISSYAFMIYVESFLRPFKKKILSFLQYIDYRKSKDAE